MDGFLQSIPDSSPPIDYPTTQKDNAHELKVQAEVTSEENVSILDGCYYHYSEYEEDVELSKKGRDLWSKIGSSENKSNPSVRVLLLNLQLKDESSNEMSEVSSLEKVNGKLIVYCYTQSYRF